MPGATFVVAPSCSPSSSYLPEPLRKPIIHVMVPRHIILSCASIDIVAQYFSACRGSRTRYIAGPAPQAR